MQDKIYCFIGDIHGARAHNFKKYGHEKVIPKDQWNRGDRTLSGSKNSSLASDTLSMQKVGTYISIGYAVVLEKSWKKPRCGLVAGLKVLQLFHKPNDQ